MVVHRARRIERFLSQPFLVAEVFTSLEQVAFVPIEELAEIEGFDEEVAEELRARGRAFLEEQDRRFEEERRGLGVHTRVLGQALRPMATTEASEIAGFLTASTGLPAGSVAFGTEAPYFNSMDTETIVIGPGSIDQAHQPDEFLPVAQIDPTVDLLGRLIDRFCLH